MTTFYLSCQSRELAFRVLFVPASLSLVPRFVRNNMNKKTIVESLPQCNKILRNATFSKGTDKNKALRWRALTKLTNKTGTPIRTRLPLSPHLQQ